MANSRRLGIALGELHASTARPAVNTGVGASLHRALSATGLLLAIVLCSAIVASPRAAVGDANICCPADFNGDDIVDGVDLGMLLAAWGSPDGDLDGDGVTDGADLGILLAAWGSCPTRSCFVTEIVGTVQLADGTPVADAVVVVNAPGSGDDATGTGMSGPDGAFAFFFELTSKAMSVQVTAIATIDAVRYTGTKLVAPVDFGGVTNAGAIVVGAEACVGEPTWLPTFGAAPGTNNAVRTLATFDDGTGPALYAGGTFTTAGSVAASRIAKWDGTAWSPLGSGLTNESYNFVAVSALASFDDGSGAGPALYVGGEFTTAGGVAASHVARWDGNAWSALGSGMGHDAGGFAEVYALTIFDDGAGGGPALYAGGAFTTAGGATVNGIAKWDGHVWSPLGSGMLNGTFNGIVYALTTFDDGSGDGPALFAAGQFTTAGGVSANRIAKWDGNAWSPLGSGMNQAVLALTTFDDGSGGGPALYAGGTFTTAGGAPCMFVAKWNGSSWSAVGGGVGNWVRTLTTFDDGSGGGPALYAGGDFSLAGGAPANRVARWNGIAWTEAGSGMNGSVSALAAFDDGTGDGPILCAGGSFALADGAPTSRIAKWDGSAWSAFGSGLTNRVRALTIFDDGTGGGPALYVGGDFVVAGGVTVNRIAKWDGSAWSALGSGVDGEVHALATFDDGLGGGPALYVGGAFTMAGGVPASRIARWDGDAWSPLGSGMRFDLTGLATVHVLTIFDDGTGDGPALYAGGQFSSAGGVDADHIAKWDGKAWSAIGAAPNGNLNGAVHAMTIFDDGTGGGPALHVAGDFSLAGGVDANRIAKWDGAAWSALGSGLGIGGNDSVRALALFDDGTGPALHAGGWFAVAGGAPASSIAKWDGSAWVALGSGVNGTIAALATFNDGTGPALYAGGQFTLAGGVDANRIAKWDGSSWSPSGAGVTGGPFPTISALAIFDDGTSCGPALHAAGQFLISPAGDSHLARWGQPAR